MDLCISLNLQKRVMLLVVQASSLSHHIFFFAWTVQTAQLFQVHPVLPTVSEKIQCVIPVSMALKNHECPCEAPTRASHLGKFSLQF